MKKLITSTKIHYDISWGTMGLRNFQKWLKERDEKLIQKAYNEGYSAGRNAGGRDNY